MHTHRHVVSQLLIRIPDDESTYCGRSQSGKCNSHSVDSSRHHCLVNANHRQPSEDSHTKNHKATRVWSVVVSKPFRVEIKTLSVIKLIKFMMS